MKGHEAPNGQIHQETLFEIADDEVVAPVTDFQAYQEMRDASPDSEALQVALEEEERERQLDDLADKLGSYDEARRRLGLSVEHSSSQQTHRRLTSVRRYYPSKVFDGDSENDPYWKIEHSHPLSEEEEKRKRQGLELARSILKGKRLEEIQALPTDEERAAALRDDRVRAQIKEQRKRSS